MLNKLQTDTMNRIREIVFGASTPSQQYLLSWLLTYVNEFKVLVFICFAFFAAVSIQVNNKSLIDIVSLYEIKVETPESLFSAPLVKTTHKKKNKVKVNVEEMIATSMSYSYSETQLGFYLKNFKFFNNTPKGKVEKRILKNLPRSLSKNASRYVRAVLQLSEKHQVDPIWVLSVMWTESQFDFTALSNAGARGLMQIMPTTKKHIYHMYSRRGHKLAVEEDDFEINHFFPYKVEESEEKTHIAKLVNIELGVIYLKSLLKYFDRNHTYATVAYNMGPGWTRDRLRNNLPVGERNHYLDKVQRAYKRISKKI